jgi:hypothetical protein
VTATGINRLRWTWDGIGIRHPRWLDEHVSVRSHKMRLVSGVLAAAVHPRTPFTVEHLLNLVGAGWTLEQIEGLHASSRR